MPSFSVLPCFNNLDTSQELKVVTQASITEVTDREKHLTNTALCGEVATSVCSQLMHFLLVRRRTGKKVGVIYFSLSIAQQCNFHWATSI